MKFIILAISILYFYYLIPKYGPFGTVPKSMKRGKLAKYSVRKNILAIQNFIVKIECLAINVFSFIIMFQDPT
jgi:hypothetical protein